jgi:ferrochelatase
MPPAPFIPSPQPPPWDALLVVSFGAPDGPGDVLPFLESVLHGRNVPRERILEVAERYYGFGGKSPLNEQIRLLIAALTRVLSDHGLRLPIYWGNRHWHPLVPDVLREMARDGVRRALAFVTSAYGSYPGCRQYLEHIAHAQREVGPGAPQVDKVRLFFNHPGFIESQVERTVAALHEIPAERRAAALILFTAHSLPLAMARTCRYEEQLHETCRLVIGRLSSSPLPLVEDPLWRREGSGVRVPAHASRLSTLDHPRWSLVYQSRSGPPNEPWLQPDVCEFLKGLGTGDWGLEAGRLEFSLASDLWPPASPLDLVIVPIGFLLDNMEVAYDLDIEARRTCDRLGINMVRAQTVGTHPRFVRMIRELVEERMSNSPQRLALGSMGPAPNTCPDDCCPSPLLCAGLPTPHGTGPEVS